MACDGGMWVSEQQPVRVSITQTQSIVTRKRDITFLKYRHQKKLIELFALVDTIPSDEKNICLVIRQDHCRYHSNIAKDDESCIGLTELPCKKRPSPDFPFQT